MLRRAHSRRRNSRRSLQTRKSRLQLGRFEDRVVPSATSWVPLDQVLMQGITQGNLIPPLSALNLYSPNVHHNLAPTGQIPPNAVATGLTDETGEYLYAVANKYIVQINVTGLSAAAAADPNQLYGYAVAQLARAKVFNPTDTTLASVTIEKYIGAGRYLVTAGTNANPDVTPFLETSLAKVAGFQSVIQDFLFPSDQLKVTWPKANNSPGAPTNSVPVLSEIGAAGGLVFSGSTSQTIGIGVTISYSLNLDAAQTLAAVVTPDSGLQATIKVTDSKGKVIGSATGSAAGALTGLQALVIGKSGTYQITIGGVGSSTGSFALQVVVNSLLQKERYLGGPNDSTLGNAQQIDALPLNLGNGISRSAVYATIPLQAGAGDSWVSERGVGVQLVSSSGAIIATLNNPALSAGAISGIHIGPNGNLYIAVDTDPGNGDGGEIVEMTQTGIVVATIPLPNDTPTNFFFYPFGFAVAPDGSLWVAQPNTGNVVHLDGAGNLIQSYFTGGTPEWAALRSDGQVFISQDADGTIQQLDPASGNMSTFATDPAGAPFGLAFDASGNLLVADPNVGVERFDSSGNLVQTITDFNQPLDVGVDSAGNVLTSTGFDTLDKFTSTGTLITSTVISGPGLGVAVVGTEGPPPAPQQLTDYYKFSLAKGQNATVVLSDLSGSSADIALLDAQGTVLALGRVLGGSEEAINSFIATSSGTYYLRVTGNGVQYSLVLETGADFANGSNLSQARAQNLFPSSKGVLSVLGSLSQTGLWGIDWQDAPSQLIHTINTQTGAFGNTFSSPETPTTNPFGFNMAFDGTNLWYNDGAFFGGNSIYQLDPTSGAVRGSFAAPDSFTGLAYLNGSLWGVNGSSDAFYQIDPSNGNVIGSFSLPIDPAITGLAGDPSRGVLWAVSQNHMLYEIDPVGQTVLKSAPDGLPLNEQDLGFFNNELYVSESLGTGFNDIAVFNADTLTETRDLPMNVATFISGLAADGIGLSSGNYYHFSAKTKDKLYITATAPYNPSQGPFQPANPLSAVLQLYDAQGNLLATSSPGGAINYTTKAGGDYYVEISAAGGTVGDYTLSVYGASGTLPAFTVTGTNPPANSYNKPLTSITVDFNDTILLSSLPNAKVTFGALSATGYTVNNDHEVTWYLQAVPGGQNVPYTFQIAAGTIKDIQGVGLTGFSETLIINTVPPHLITNSISEGSIGSDGRLTYVCSFQEPMVPSSVSASSFDLHGIYHNADYTAASFSFDPTDTVLTITFSSLPQDNYTLTLLAPGFQDRAGYILDGEPGAPPSLVPSGDGTEGGDFVVDFTLRHGAEALPITFGPVAPIGDQIYQGAFKDVIANPPGATNTYTVNLAPNQTLTLDLTNDGNLQGTVNVYDPSNYLIASATASGQGAELVLQTVPITGGGTYTIVVGGANNTEGLFNLQATLNAAATTGPHDTLATAQDLSSSFLSEGATASRGAVLGGISKLIVNYGDAFASERGGSGLVVVANAGGIDSALNDPVFSTGVVQSVREGADGNIYVGLDTSAGLGTGGEILKFSPDGTRLATIHLPNDTPTNFLYYPFGFAVASDGTFWVAQPNTGNVIHVDATGNVLQSYHTGGDPEWTAVRADGQVFISQDSNNTILQLDPSGGTITTFATDPFDPPNGLNFTPSGNLLVADFYPGVEVFDPNGNLVQSVLDVGALDVQLDPSGNFMIANPFFDSVDKLDPNGNPLTSTPTPGAPIGVSVAGVDGPTPPAPALDNYYSFSLNAGQSTTIAYTQLSGSGTATIILEDGGGNVLASATAGPSNFSQVISNFVAPTGGTYYIHVHGNSINYDVTVTRDAAFDTEPNDSQATAQALPTAGTAVGAVFVPAGVSVGTTLEGMNFDDSTCGCIPPDTNDAVGPTQVVEAINTAIRVYDKTTGNILLQQDIGSLFGISAFSDPYIVYDDIANRFVFVELTSNSAGGDGVALAVSNDSNFLDGFLPVQIVDFGSNVLDFPKVGFNADAYVITGNLFTATDAPLQIIAVDKAQLFAGSFVAYEYQRSSAHFRAEVPAQMHGATPGMPMYLVEEAGFGNGQAARVVTLTNELSNNPTFVDTDIPVDLYSFPPPADQPGASASVATNDTTFSHAEWRMINGQGMLVSAQNVSVPDDGFTTSRVRWYEFSTDGTPSLVQQGTINPGTGVSTYYGAPALDINGDIGITYMESSASEFVSMYVAGRLVADPLGTMSAGTVVAPGIATDFNFGRTGDYGGMSVDPTDGLTFWAAHEYAGTNAVYNTALASFTIPTAHDEDWYSVAASDGATLNVTLTLPGSSSGAQFINNLSPVIELYDQGGNLVASGTTSLSYQVPAGGAGSYAVRVTSANGTEGEYVLQVTDPVAAPLVPSTPPVSGAPKPVASTTSILGSSPVQGGATSVLQIPALQSWAHSHPDNFGLLPGLSTPTAAASQPSGKASGQTTGTAPQQGSTEASDALFALYGSGASATEQGDVFSALPNTLVWQADEAGNEWWRA